MDRLLPVKHYVKKFKGMEFDVREIEGVDVRGALAYGDVKALCEGPLQVVRTRGGRKWGDELQLAVRSPDYKVHKRNFYGKKSGVATDEVYLSHNEPMVVPTLIELLKAAWYDYRQEVLDEAV